MSIYVCGYSTVCYFFLNPADYVVIEGDIMVDTWEEGSRLSEGYLPASSSHPESQLPSYSMTRPAQEEDDHLIFEEQYIPVQKNTIQASGFLVDFTQFQ